MTPPAAGEASFPMDGWSSAGESADAHSGSAAAKNQPASPKSKWLPSLHHRRLLIILLAFAPAIVFAIALGVAATEKSRAQRYAELQLRLIEAVDQERTTMLLIQQTLRLAANDIVREFDETGDCVETLRRTAEDFEWSTLGLVFNADGESSCGAKKPLNIAESDYWKRFAESERFTVGDARKGRLTGKPVVVVVTRIHSERSELFALAFGVDVAYLSALREAAGREVTVSLIGASGKALLTGDGPASDTDDWLPSDRSELLQFGDRRVSTIDRVGRRQTYFTSEIAQGEIWAVAALPERSLFEIATSAEASVVAFPLMGCLFAVGAVYIALRRLITPHFERLREIATAFREGRSLSGFTRTEDAPEEVALLEETMIGMGLALNEKNARLAEALENQKRMLMEVHHRVKNNLQTVSSLVSIEARRVDDDVARASLGLVQERLDSLSMIHQRLYQSSDVDEVEMSDLIRDIVGHVNKTLSAAPAATTPTMDLDKLPVDTVQATPISLFVTEAIGNAFKHGHETPEIEIRLTTSRDSFELHVGNRIGENPAKPRRFASIGRELMRGFAAQISGQVTEVRSEDRYEVTLTGPTRKAAALFAI